MSAFDITIALLASELACQQAEEVFGFFFDKNSESTSESIFDHLCVRRTAAT
jgi:hypothetical protein